MDEETTAPDQSPSRAPSRASAALRLAGHREISADDTTFRPGPDLGSRSASLRLQLFTTPPDRAGSTPAEATRTCHGFPSRNPNRTRRDTHHAITVLEQARRENVPIEELVSYVERHALAADASEGQRQVLESLFNLGNAIQPDGEGHCINRQHRSQALMDAGAGPARRGSGPPLAGHVRQVCLGHCFVRRIRGPYMPCRSSRPYEEEFCVITLRSPACSRR